VVAECTPEALLMGSVSWFFEVILASMKYFQESKDSLL